MTDLDDKSPAEDAESQKPESQDTALPVDRARRRLMQLAVYAPPAVLGALSLKSSGKQPMSCGPLGCQPNPCDPFSPCPPQSCNPQGCPPSRCPPRR